MATDTQTAESLLDMAAAIVEAEWMRLEQDADLWADVADLFAEMPAPGACRPRVGVATTELRRPGRPLPVGTQRWALRDRPAMQVWATQRSPPRSTRVLLRRAEIWGGDASERCA
jgi:hypothetical protein